MIIALSGPKGSGKSTAMLELDPISWDATPRGGPAWPASRWVHLPFAGPLKTMLATLIGWDAINDRELRELPHDLLAGRTPRWAMQSLGTEWGRDCIGADIWVNAWAARADAVLQAGGMVVTDDLRFPNEHDAIAERGGVVVEVNRPGFRRSNEHASEAWAPPADFVLQNNGDLEDLRFSMFEIASQLGNTR